MATRNEVDGSLSIISNRNGNTSSIITSSLASVFTALPNLNNNSAQALDSFTEARENFLYDDSA